MTDNSSTPPAHLSGNGRPVVEETFNNQLNVTGTIPAVLDGQYMRNGSNPYSGTSAHPFLGDGMLHGLELSCGRAISYRNRWVQTAALGTDNWTLLSNLGNTSLVHHYNDVG